VDRETVQARLNVLSALTSHEWRAQAGAVGQGLVWRLGGARS
jgi:hypothetical protein